MIHAVLFYLISFLAILGAIGVVTARSAVYGVLSLVFSVCMLAGLFGLLKAFFVATVLVLVYAGAILVLFLFVIMLIDFRKKTMDWGGFGMPAAAAVAVGGIFCWECLTVIRTLAVAPAAPVHGTAQAIGRVLFGRFILPFELTSFLLLAAVISVVVLAKKDIQ